MFGEFKVGAYFDADLQAISSDGRQAAPATQGLPVSNRPLFIARRSEGWAWRIFIIWLCDGPAHQIATANATELATVQFSKSLKNMT